MKNIVSIIVLICSVSLNAQWMGKTSCNKKSDKIVHSAMNHMSNLEFMIAYGMAKAALEVDDECGSAQLILAAVSSSNKNWGSRKDKLTKINRASLSKEEQVWYDYLNAANDTKKALQERAVSLFPNSPLVHFLGTNIQDFSTYEKFAERFPKLSAFAHNMMSYGYMDGTLGGEPDTKKAMDHVEKALAMHDGPNALDSKAEHLAAMGKYDEALQVQLKAVDYADFASPYWQNAVVYWNKSNKASVSESLMKAQKEMQDAILQRDYETYKKYEHEDIVVTTGDSNLNPFYVFSKENLKEEMAMTWGSFDLSDMNVYYSPDMKSAAITFFADGAYTMNDDNTTVDYATRGSSFWVATNNGWKILHSSWAPRKGKIGIPERTE